jgi:hypothetical protein
LNLASAKDLRGRFSYQNPENRFEYVRKFEDWDALAPSNWIVVRIDGRGFSKWVLSILWYLFEFFELLSLLCCLIDVEFGDDGKAWIREKVYEDEDIAYNREAIFIMLLWTTPSLYLLRFGTPSSLWLPSITRPKTDVSPDFPNAKILRNPMTAAP